MYFFWSKPYVNRNLARQDAGLRISHGDLHVHPAGAFDPVAQAGTAPTRTLRLRFIEADER